MRVRTDRRERSRSRLPNAELRPAETIRARCSMRCSLMCRAAQRATESNRARQSAAGRAGVRRCGGRAGKRQPSDLRRHGAVLALVGCESPRRFRRGDVEDGCRSRRSRYHMRNRGWHRVAHHEETDPGGVPLRTRSVEARRLSYIAGLVPARALDVRSLLFNAKAPRPQGARRSQVRSHLHRTFGRPSLLPLYRSASWPLDKNE